jgi:hypothetical protein
MIAIAVAFTALGAVAAAGAAVREGPRFARWYRRTSQL